MDNVGDKCRSCDLELLSNSIRRLRAWDRSDCSDRMIMAAQCAAELEMLPTVCSNYSNTSCSNGCILSAYTGSDSTCFTAPPMPRLSVEIGLFLFSF